MMLASRGGAAGARGGRGPRACGAGGGRRRAGALALAGGAAFGGNLGGVTSLLLGATEAGAAAAGRLGLDVLYPVRGLKRCREAAFEFVYPAEWLADQTLLRRAAERADARGRLDPPALQDRSSRQPPVAPAVGFGPAGGSGELNVSVVAERVPPGFSLAAGVGGGTEVGWGPERAGQLLGTAIAPEGSGRRAKLVGTSAREEEGVAYYGLEYTVQREGAGGFFRRNQSVFAARSGVLYTLTLQCPEGQWPAARSGLAALAPSFRLR